LELHRTLLSKLLGDLGPARDVARANLDRMRSSVRGAQAQAWLDEWSQLIDNPGPRLIDVFLGEDEHSTDLRQPGESVRRRADAGRKARRNRAGA
jgi:hypothetical protein